MRNAGSHGKNSTYRPSAWDEPKSEGTRVDFWMGIVGIICFLLMSALGAAIVCAWWGIWPSEWTP